MQIIISEANIPIQNKTIPPASWKKGFKFVYTYLAVFPSVRRWTWVASLGEKNILYILYVTPPPPPKLPLQQPHSNHSFLSPDRFYLNLRQTQQIYSVGIQWLRKSLAMN